jgi:hypothetical protein
MHQFICKVKGGVITPLSPFQVKLLNKILDTYETQNKTIKVSFEFIDKNINEAQHKLYKAFVLKAADHFGNIYPEMQDILKVFYPEDVNGEKIPVDRWSSEQLNLFITKSTAYLAEHGFNF